MRWIITVECVGEDGRKSAITLGTIERVAGGTVSGNVGVNLQEAKEIMHRLQEAVTEQQLQEHCKQKRKCSSCGSLRPVKDYRRRHLDTVLGTVQFKAPRYHACPHCPGKGVSSPISELLPERTTPELRHLQVSLGAQIPYRQAAKLLQQLLPPTGGTNHTTTRSRVLAVGDGIDEEIQRAVAENGIPDQPAKQMVIGIDGAFVKGRRPTDRASLEIVTGRIETEAEPSKMFAIVRDQDGQAQQRLQAVLRRRGRGPDTKVRVVSDGEDGMRSMVGRWFDGNEEHVLDWYHIARRFEAIGKSLVYLPHLEPFGYWLGRHWGQLNRAKWKVWHGNVYGAYVALTSFYDGVDIHTMLAEEDSRRTTSLEQIRVRVNELCSYLRANESRLIDYGKECRAGHAISTARVESTVNQLVDWRMEKKRHMRWTQRGAQMLLHVRCALLNGELGKHTGWFPLERSAADAVAA
jgi:hypothetical protein